MESVFGWDRFRFPVFMVMVQPNHYAGIYRHALRNSKLTAFCDCFDRVDNFLLLRQRTVVSSSVGAFSQCVVIGLVWVRLFGTVLLLSIDNVVGTSRESAYISLKHR